MVKTQIRSSLRPEVTPAGRQDKVGVRCVVMKAGAEGKERRQGRRTWQVMTEPLKVRRRGVTLQAGI